MKLIDKDKAVAEIEKLRETYNKYPTRNNYEDGLKEGRMIGYKDALYKIRSLEVKEVDLDNHTIMEEIRKCGCNPSEFDVARHFFELGLKANQEDNVIGTLERKVKIDAGGYPCIDCYIEFYDYDKDVPLAKEGDKVKVIVVKGE